MPVARLSYHGVTDQIVCETVYNQQFVDDLKRSVPAQYRRWRPDSKLWVVSRLYERELLRVCRAHFDDVLVEDDQPRELNIPDHYRTLGVLPGVPKPVLDGAYRAWTRMHHPDVSDAPDATVRMQEINAAYERAVGEVAS